jgi:hypothetical protein
VTIVNDFQTGVWRKPFFANIGRADTPKRPLFRERISTGRLEKWLLRSLFPHQMKFARVQFGSLFSRDTHLPI